MRCVCDSKDITKSGGESDERIYLELNIIFFFFYYSMFVLVECEFFFSLHLNVIPTGCFKRVYVSITTSIYIIIRII